MIPEPGPGAERSRSEGFWQRAFDAMGDAVFLIDPARNVVCANRAAEQLVGERLVGRPCYAMLHGSATPPSGCPSCRAIDSGLPARFETQEAHLGNRHYEFSVFPVVDAQGKTELLVHLVRDVTARKDLQHRLVQAEKLEAVGRLAGGVAHDFNNLLTAITIFGGMARDRLPHGDPRRDDIGQALAAADRGARLTQQLLAYSRSQPHDAAPVELNESVQNMRQLLQRTLGEDVALRVVRHPDPVRVFGDPVQIDQVLLNLCINARDAMPDGGAIELEVGVRRLRDAAELPGLPAGEYASLDVRDTGSGMDPETLGRIFEPFFTTKPRTQGTGLGLATVLGVVEAMDGRVLVESTPGCGSRFTVLLPRWRGDAHAAPAPVETVAPGSGTVLIVEDDPDVARAARSTLEAVGYRTLVAATGREARAMAQTAGAAVDVLFTDVVLTDESGYELAASLRQQLPGIGVLLTTGWAPGLSGRRAPGDLGAILWKPYSPSRLSAAIGRALAERHGRPAKGPDTPLPIG